ncbi:SCO family protein [Vibrio hippocampi]|uniref:SCO family protein n=1 Tax=Vibrio hippocampi TaxID=654686 RepID=A0ABM8ZPE3_9VIBR|nr:SCO family protein [Vibrio hippocampi]CAH0530357.1 hypothetical protein VHP8226_04000 [Vibrio hippocampi]
MKFKWLLLALAAFVLGISSKLYLDYHTQQKKMDQLAQVPDSVLYGKHNRPVTLFAASDPRIRILYFGFTRCPDVCPTSLAMLAGALNQLEVDTLDQIWPIFISLDPERDSAEAASEYAGYFHPRIDGLSAPLNITQPLAHQYGVIFRKTELEDSKLGYTLDHSSYFYILQPDGSLIEKVPHTLTPAPLLEAIRRVTQKQYIQKQYIQK